MLRFMECDLYVHKQCFLVDLCKEKEGITDTVTSPGCLVDEGESLDMTNRTVLVRNR